MRRNRISLNIRLSLKAVLALIGSLCWCVGGTEAALAEHHFDNWTTDSGLPHNTVVSIRQTSDGYLWLATKDGLVRYDGVRFTVFNKGNSPGINSNRLTVLFVDSHGNLLAGTEEGEIIRYKDGVFTNYLILEQKSHNEITNIQEDGDGNIWVTSHAGIVKWKDGYTLSFAPSSDLQGNLSWQLTFGDLPQLKCAGLWYADTSGIHRLERGRWITYGGETGLPGLDTYSLCEDQDGSLWFATPGALRKLRDGKVTVYPIKGSLDRFSATVVCEDNRGVLWIGTNGALHSLKDGQLTSYTEGFSSGLVEDLFRDREGTVWVATHNGGLFKVRDEVIKIYAQRDGLIANNVYPICEDNEGAVWIGAWDRGLSRFKDNRFTSFAGTGGSPLVNPEISIWITALHVDRQGRLWVGSFHGIHLFDGRNFRRVPIELNEDGEVASAIVDDHQGNLWLGTQMGLLRYRDGNLVRFDTNNGLVNNDVKVILETRAGDLWIGTYGGVTRIRGGKFTSYTERDGLASSRVRSLYEDSDGALWIGTYDGGLTRLKDGKFTTYTPKDGLSDNGVFVILEDNFGNFWMSCNRGIYRVSKQQLNEFAEGKRKSVSCVKYDKGDGLRNIECNGGRWPAGAKTRDGKLWFATQEGVAVIDPAEVRLNTLPPTTVIDSCILDHQPVLNLSRVQIDPGKENLEISYAGLSFIKAELVRFKYRLEGLDADWVEAGARRTAYYPYLPPGNYTFRVLAANGDGIWSEEPASLEVIVIPPYYRRWWFYAMGTLVIGAAILLIYERRISRLRRARLAQEAFSKRLIESQESERKRIAAELHDSLGQSLLVIKNRALLGLRKREDEEASQKQFSEIELTASHAIEEVRSISHNLRPYLLDRLGLTESIEAMLSSVFDPSPVRLSSDIDSIDGLFSVETEIHIYRILQECINNIVKHSEASHAHIAIKAADHVMQMTIRDDGKGFSTAQEDGRSEHPAGLGLKGIMERTRIIGGKCTVRSSPGNGTEINFRVAAD